MGQWAGIEPPTFILLMERSTVVQSLLTRHGLQPVNLKKLNQFRITSGGRYFWAWRWPSYSDLPWERMTALTPTGEDEGKLKCKRRFQNFGGKRSADPDPGLHPGDHLRESGRCPGRLQCDRHDA